ncbi:MAG: hypothetical protein L0Y54_20680 [Sporichthyaceae bacterium]|nr:hypothetical protein [Sporichthyaceae bacterium]
MDRRDPQQPETQQDARGRIETSIRRFMETPGRNRTLALVAAGLVVLLIAGVAVFSAPSDKSPTSATRTGAEPTTSAPSPTETREEEEKADRSRAAGYTSAEIAVNELPDLAREMLPTIQAELAEQCPALPVEWVLAQVNAESGWDPRNWTDDVNGGTAGLYQINEEEWVDLGGKDWNVSAHVKPPRDHAVWKPEETIKRGIKLMCGHLTNMTDYLKDSDKDISPLDAMMVCHIAGCGRVTQSDTGFPSVGEVGCGGNCVRLIKQYRGNIYDYLGDFTLGEFHK